MEDPKKTGSGVICVLCCGAVRRPVDCPPSLRPLTGIGRTSTLRSIGRCMASRRTSKRSSAFLQLCIPCLCVFESRPRSPFCHCARPCCVVDDASGVLLPSRLPHSGCMYQPTDVDCSRRTDLGQHVHRASALRMERASLCPLHSPSVISSKTESARKSQFSLFFSDHDFLLDSPCVSSPWLSR